MEEKSYRRPIGLILLASSRFVGKSPLACAVFALSLTLVPGYATASAPGSGTRDSELPRQCVGGGACDVACLSGCELAPFVAPVLTGKMTVIADDLPGDLDPGVGNPVITVLLRLDFKGTRYLFAKSLQNTTADGPKTWMGTFGWFQPDGASGSSSPEDVVDFLSFNMEYQPPVGPLEPVGAAILEAADTIFGASFDPTGKWPMITAWRSPPGNEVDQGANPANPDLAKVLELDIRIDFLDGFTPPTPTP